MEPVACRTPESARRAWVSDEARETWEPRIRRIGDAWSEITWASVAAGLRRCAIVHLTPERMVKAAARWTECGLNTLPLQADKYGREHVVLRIAVGRGAATREMKHCYDKNDQDGIGRLLGYPQCCRAFFQRTWTGERRTDTTWAMAANTSAPDDGQIIRVDGPLYCNILNRWDGVRAVQHLPCRFDCAPSCRLGERFLALARDAGLSDEVDWIEEILDWPVEWSSLHGIAEIRNPVAKVVTQTDATLQRLTVRWLGRGFPALGAVGLRFPYRAPHGASRPAEKPSPILPDASAPPLEAHEWFYGDNGFTSFRAMQVAHSPIVEFARSVLGRCRGAVLDLGCGNGALLNALCRHRRKWTPFGVDSNPDAIAHARLIHPRRADNFVCADMFDATEWIRGRRYALALLMPDRLLEKPPEAAAQLTKALLEASEHVLASPRR